MQAECVCACVQIVCIYYVFVCRYVCMHAYMARACVTV